MYNVIFNNRRCLDMGVLVVRRPDIPAPITDVVEYAVPGRDGIIQSRIKRLEPLDFDIEFNFLTRNPNHFGDVFRRCKRWLSGSGKLTFSDDLEWFYQVYRVEIIDSERTSKRLGNFTASFRCDPYVYSQAGDRWQSIEDCLINNYNICQPLYHVTASGDWTLTVNGNAFSGSGETFIDTAEMVAYGADETIKNTTTIGDFEDFYLNEGENEISISGGTLMIKPRWRSK